MAILDQIIAFRRPIFFELVISTWAYPGPEFVVANTLAKWKKLEPISQGRSQKVVSRSWSVFNSLSASDFVIC